MPKKKQIKEYELRKAVTKFSQNVVPRPDTDLPPPLPDQPISEVKNLFISRLLKIPIFKEGKNALYLRAPECSSTIELKDKVVQVPKWWLLDDPKHPKTVVFRDRDLLLDRLAWILIFHFKNIQIDSEIINSERFMAFAKALGEFISWKKELISSDIFNEKSFKKTVDRITRWIETYLKDYLNKGFSPNERTQLVIDLYASFRKSLPKKGGRRRFPDKAAFYWIAHILKEFGIEEGTIMKIFNRIKRDYHRKIP